MAYNNRLMTPLAAQMPQQGARRPSGGVETLAQRMMPVPTGPPGLRTTAPSGGAGLPPTPAPPPQPVPSNSGSSGGAPPPQPFPSNSGYTYYNSSGGAGLPATPPPVTGNHPGPGGTNRTGPLFGPPPAHGSGLGATPPPTGAVTPPTDPSSQALLNEGFSFQAANGPLGTVSTQGYFVPPGETIDQVTGGAPTPGNILGPGGTIVPAGQAGAPALQQLLGIGGYGSTPFVTDAAGNPTLPVGWTPATPIPNR